MFIETKRLIVRNYEMKDITDMCEYMLQRVDEKFESYPGFTFEKGEEEIAFRVKFDEFYAIELKENHKVIGNVYFGKRDFNSRELGFVLNKEYIGHGYAREASKAIIEHFFNNGLHRVYAECNPDNVGSWKAMESLGMQREAIFKQNHSSINDKNGNPIYCDTYVYALLSV